MSTDGSTGAVVEVEKLEDGVSVLRMTAGENRFNPTMLGGPGVGAE